MNEKHEVEKKAMRMAIDGKPFDIDRARAIQKGDVEIIQYLRPNGKRRRMLASVGTEFALKAREFIITAEDLAIGIINITVQKKGEKEISAFAQNGPGPDSPTAVLIRLIKMTLGEAADDRKE